MKKKKIILSIAFLMFFLTVLGIIIVSIVPEKEVISYSKIVFEDYQFEINDEYKYKYIKEKKHGILESDKFLTSFIYIAEEEFSTLIRQTSYYTNMNSEELDSIIEESKFGDYDGFTNIKKVYYDDVQKEYYLVVILIRISEKNTLVFQYELEEQEGVIKIIDDIEEGLKKIEKKV